MSIRNLLIASAENQEWANVYAKSINAATLSVDGDTPAIMNNLDVLETLNVTGDLIANGNNYSTPDIGLPNYSLHTDGAGATFWAPDDTGSGDIGYNGIAPTVAGQLSRFSGVDGLTVDQSAITDDGTNLNLNNQNITNVNLVDGVDIPAFKLDYDNKVNQDVKLNSSPTFTDLMATQHIIYDPLLSTPTFDWRSYNGQLQLYNNTGNVQVRVDNNDFFYTDIKMRSGGEFQAGSTAKMEGAVTFNTGVNTYVLPTTRPAGGQLLAAQDSGGGLNWYSTISAPMGELQYGNGGVLNYNTTLTNINQWYELGSVTSETLTTNNADFTLPKFQKGVGAGRLQYTGNKTSHFNISYSYSGSSTIAIRSFQMCLSINGVIINSSIVDTDFISNPDRTTFTANKMLLLGINDYVSIFVRCTSSAGEIINIANTNICALSSSTQIL